MMTPNDIYTARSIHEEDWRETDAETIQDVFGIAGFSYRFFDARQPLDGARIVFEKKVEYHDGDEAGTDLTAVSLDGNPFALISNLRNGSSESRDVFITDEDRFRRAREHIVSFLVEAELGHSVVDAATHRLRGTQQAVLVTVKDELRLANPFHCRWSDGVLVFDEVALRRKFDETVRPDFERLLVSGLTEPDMRRRAMKVFAAAVPPRFHVLDVDYVNAHGKWIAIAFADGVHTHLVTVDARDFNRGAGWIDQGTSRVGPPSVLHALEALVEGRSVAADSPAVVDLARTFGMSSELGLSVLNRWLADCTGDLCEDALEALGTEVPADPQEGPLEGYRVAAYVADHPEAVVYCVDGYPSQKQARELMESLERTIGRKTAKAAAPKIG